MKKVTVRCRKCGKKMELKVLNSFWVFMCKYVLYIRCYDCVEPKWESKVL